MTCAIDISRFFEISRAAVCCSTEDCNSWLECIPVTNTRHVFTISSTVSNVGFSGLLSFVKRVWRIRISNLILSSTESQLISGSKSLVSARVKARVSHALKPRLSSINSWETPLTRIDCECLWKDLSEPLCCIEVAFIQMLAYLQERKTSFSDIVCQHGAG